jgi:hypothetical protein
MRGNFGNPETLKAMTVWVPESRREGCQAMEGQRSTDDTDAPPPRAAVAAARRAEIEETRRHGNGQDREMTISVFPGVLVIILAALSAIAVWMAT